MATKAHCAYCFENLSASLEKRQPLSLQQVEEYLQKYFGEETTEVPEEGLEVEDEDSDGTAEDFSGPNAQLTGSYRPAAISRLTATSQSTGSSSSSLPSTGVSTPSTNASAATSATSVTSGSPPRSIFSLGRRNQHQDKSAPSQTDEYPLFVTWNTISRNGNKSLRGCIGTFDNQELSDGLKSYALTAAFDDHRFMPISARELPTLECGVTLLTDFETASNPMDWEIGKHGLRISFHHHGRRFGATYLPDVAREQGWTKEETIVSLMRKANWNGRREDWRKVDLNVVRYQGDRETMEYREWREWRDWVDEQEDGTS
ncbi:hypothetical protein M501DRAFT_1007684 [Patellaria atrata CBS 101060]|uniref:AMMECR1 domain-containing protein n=1 Tax=Patellaria atrata CBS 101060 TaxID=1346257 RepID=A0A9P4VPT8_9PEZI|nr:hypothetical protein M501DRAFT_1007684 [Patellaria atrata CBS 101060]